MLIGKFVFTLFGKRYRNRIKIINQFAFAKDVKTYKEGMVVRIWFSCFILISMIDIRIE